MIFHFIVAFLIGLQATLHCVGMCGPLACSLMPVRRDQGDPVARPEGAHFFLKASRMSRAAPRVMPESATLKAGQCQVPTYQSTKSTT